MCVVMGWRVVMEDLPLSCPEVLSAEKVREICSESRSTHLDIYCSIPQQSRAGKGRRFVAAAKSCLLNCSLNKPVTVRVAQCLHTWSWTKIMVWLGCGQLDDASLHSADSALAMFPAKAASAAKGFAHLCSSHTRLELARHKTQVAEGPEPLRSRGQKL